MLTEALVLENGKVWTGAAFARSVTIADGRIASLDGSAPANARVVDLGGRLVVPGFFDNHLHFVMGSLQLDAIQLRDATTLEGFASRIAERARSVGPGQWITGGGWDEQRWSRPLAPSRASIDAATAENPVFVTRLDLHMGLANGVALRLAGITRETSDPPGGTIVRSADGEPTGLLKDAAMRLVAAVIPSTEASARARAIRPVLSEAARFGVRSFCDMSIAPDSYDDFRALQRIERDGELTARVWSYLPIASWERLRDAGLERGFGSARLRIGGLKGFADGSLGSATAAFREPYEDEACNCGLLMEPMLDGSMSRWITGADASELQLAIHAIGDRANADVLSIYEALPAYRERRLRIEHAQHLDA
ncbi:MAG: amidohydrolase, partial [Thermoanaerobaculia bacterium]